jgi:hypothetical protein
MYRASRRRIRRAICAYVIVPRAACSQLLRDVFFPLEQTLLARLHEAGFEGLRPTHNAVLRFLDEHGTRASELARRSGLTRQALTQIVDDLERTATSPAATIPATAVPSSSSTQTAATASGRRARSSPISNATSNDALARAALRATAEARPLGARRRQG